MCYFSVALFAMPRSFAVSHFRLVKRNKVCKCPPLEKCLFAHVIYDTLMFGYQNCMRHHTDFSLSQQSARLIMPMLKFHKFLLAKIVMSDNGLASDPFHNIVAYRTKNPCRTLF